MIDFDALIAQASLPEETVPICLDGKLVRRWEALRDHIAADTPAQPANDQRLVSKPARHPQQDELDQLTEQVRAKNLPWVIRAMDRDKFAEFVAMPEFAARKDAKGEVNPRDRSLGVNTDVFIPALVKASLVDPDVEPDGRWERLRPHLANSQMMRLFNAAWSINNEDRDVPFSPGGSPSQPSSATA